jgi:beta-lactamase class A
MESAQLLSDIGSPARHYASGRHRPDTDGVPGPWPLAWRVGRIRPQFLTAAAVALALVSAGAVYVTHAQVPLRSEAGVSASTSSPGAVAGQRLPAVLTRVAEMAVAPPEGVRADASAGQGAAASGVPAAPPAAVVPARAAPIGPELDARISAIIAANSRYQLGVALIDVSDGAVHGYGVQDKFVAASTAKILAAAAYYDLVERGLASLTARMGASTAGAQIRQMVQQSNNESWALILGAVGKQGLRNYAAKIGIDYDRTLNTLTPVEMARTLELLYTGRLLNTEHTRQLLSYMQNTNFETLIPAAVPPGVSVFHKYGLLFGNLHDASILAKDGRAYVFVVYTLGKNLSDMNDRGRVIRSLTETVTAGLF